MSHFLRRLREAPCAPLLLLHGGKSYPGRSGEGCLLLPAPVSLKAGGPGWGPWLCTPRTRGGPPLHLHRALPTDKGRPEGQEGAQGWAMLGWGGMH